MKYMIETNNDSVRETLSFQGKEYQKTWKRASVGIETKDNDFCEQLESDGVSRNITDHIYELIDNSFLPADLLDFVGNEM